MEGSRSCHLKQMLFIKSDGVNFHSNLDVCVLQPASFSTLVSSKDETFIHSFMTFPPNFLLRE